MKEPPAAGGSYRGGLSSPLIFPEATGVCATRYQV